MKGQTHVLTVWGDLACFTRPESKVERYSYPLITPSSARGIFDAIYWKPEASFYWQIERIEVLEPVTYIALRRNEVKDKVPPARTVLAWAEGKAAVEPLWADGAKDTLGTDQRGRTQRQTMALKNVCYRLHAHVCLRETGDPRPLDAQFERRAAQGKCIYQPYLGCREFPAFFEPTRLREDQRDPAPIDLDLGWMLYDVFDLGAANGPDARPAVSLFPARLEGGVMEVPAYDDPRVAKGVEVPQNA
jgi:CRISPR-associated protein Cas5d